MTNYTILDEFDQDREREKVCRTFDTADGDVLDRMEEDVAAVIGEKVDRCGLEQDDLDPEDDPELVFLTLLYQARQYAEADREEWFEGRTPDEHFDLLRQELNDRGQNAHNSVSVVLGMLSTTHYRTLSNAILEEKYS